MSDSLVRVLLLDDVDMSTQALKTWLQREGAHVVTLRDFFEVPPLLDSQPFDLLIGHEVFLMVAREMASVGKRVLLTDRPEDWSVQVLELLGVSAVLTSESDEDDVRRLVASVRAG